MHSNLVPFSKIGTEGLHIIFIPKMRRYHFEKGLKNCFIDNLFILVNHSYERILHRTKPIRSALTVQTFLVFGS